MSSARATPLPRIFTTALALAVIAGGVLAPVSAVAQISLQNFYLAPDQSDFVTLSCGDVLPHGVAAATFAMDGAAQSLVLSDPNLSLPRQSIVSSRIGAQLSAAVGLWNRLELRGWAGVLAYQSGLNTSFTREKVGFTDLGYPRFDDLRLGARFLLAHGSGAAPAVSVGETIGLPTGAAESLNGERAPTFTTEASLSWPMAEHALALRAGYVLRPEVVPLAATRMGDVATLAAAFKYGVDGRYDTRRSVILEVISSFLVRNSVSPESPVSLTGTLAYRYQAVSGKTPMAIVLGASGAVLTTPGSPTFRAFVAFEGASRNPQMDKDGDGIADRRDHCVNKAEDYDGFEDDDGCPEYDNDNDGVPDEDDECPLVADDPGSNADDDGCPTVILADKDNDSIPDVEDKCPNEPEDRDYFEDLDGCPDLDNDKDGLSDIADLCPLVAEDKNGVQDDDGCPDGGKGPVLVSYERGVLTLTRAITFQEGGVELHKASMRVVEQLGKLLRSTSDIKHITIVVYASKGGKAARQLAAARAQKLMVELNKLGVGAGMVRGGAAHWTRKQAGSVVITPTGHRGAKRSGR